MSSVNKALATQIKNIEEKTGKSRAELVKTINASGLSKHGEKRTFAQETFGLGYGDANTLVHLAKEAAEGGGEVSLQEALDAIYAAGKAELRPLHGAVMQAIAMLGEFEIAPKKKYISLRRKKQFATIGPAAKGRIEIGLNMKDFEAGSRLEELPAGRMCQYRVFVSDEGELDAELLAWVRRAYESAG